MHHVLPYLPHDPHFANRFAYIATPHRLFFTYDFNKAGTTQRIINKQKNPKKSKKYYMSRVYGGDV